jgi:RNA polymerase sigma-70 factor (ECF subfamily)
MAVSKALRDDLVSAIPNLRAFAVSLTGSSERADDLVQETLMKAWAKFDTFQEGTNLRAWLFTILRNEFYSQLRKRGREVEDVEGAYTARLAAEPQQGGHMDLEDFRRALAELPPDQREALILVGASGFSYEEAAEICECAVGTIKSRVSRARTRLAQLLKLDPGETYGADPISASVITRTVG